MQGRIGHLHCRYRILGDRSRAGAITARLDRIAQDSLAETYARSLDRVFGDDPSVHVIRRIRAGTVLSLTQLGQDGALSQRWAEHLAGAVVHTVAGHVRGDDNLITFPDQAAFVAQFIEELLAGSAWRRWYYGAFRHLEALDITQALLQVLQENRERLAAILAELERRGLLVRVLARLQGPHAASLWQQAIRAPTLGETGGVQVDTDGTGPVTPPPSAARDPARPGLVAANRAPGDRALFEQACSLIDGLGIWRQEALDRAALFGSFHGRGVVDWNDPRTLTAYLEEVLDYLGRQGYLKHFGNLVPMDFPQRLERALAGFDWLDQSRLRAAVWEQVGRAAESTGRRSSPRLTPRQRDLLEALRAVVGQSGRSLGAVARQDAAALKLALYSVLVARESRWAEDALAIRVLDALAALVAAIARGESPPRVRAWLRAEPESLGPDGDHRPPASLEAALAVVRALGEEAEALLGELAMRPESGQALLECPWAGVLLLLRAMLDLRLPLLAQGQGYPQAEGVERLWLPLLVRLAGRTAVDKDRLDPALQRLADSAEADWASWRRPWDSVETDRHQAFLMALGRVLAGQRLLAGERLHLHRVYVHGRMVWVAGDAESGCWPFWLKPQQLDEALALLLERWRTVTGREPNVITVDAPFTASPDAPCIVVPAADQDPEGCDPAVTAHRANRQFLDGALAALDAGSLGLPGADLTLALTAIHVLRTWARWLPRFADASVPYLLTNLIRRGGVLRLSTEAVEVELEPAPLDVLIELAGYTAEMSNVAWLGHRDVRYRIRRPV